MARKTREGADDKLIAALACGATVEAAARQAGVTKRTVFRRLLEPEFKRRLQEFRTELVGRTANVLTAAATESVRTLLELQKSPTHHSTRLGAAKAILELGIRLRESAQFEGRISSLEQLFAEARK